MSVEDSIVGDHANPSANSAGRQKQSEVEAGLKIDTAKVRDLDRELAKIKDTAKGIADELSRAAEAGTRLSGAMGGAGAGTTNGMVTTGVNTSPPAGSTAAPTAGGVGGMFGGGMQGTLASIGGMFGGGAAVGGSVLAAGAIGAVGSRITSAVDARIDRNRSYALPADRLGMEMQMRYGISKQQYLNMRAPLMDYHLGTGGANELLGFQAQTGFGADRTAPAASAMRLLSGGSLSTGDVLGIMNQNLNPAVANRQFMMMGGLSMYGPGGQPRDYMSLLRTRMQMFQLDNPVVSRGALREGSISRNRMTTMGITADEQDLLINLGQAQSSFRKAGGVGAFDPNNKEHRKIAGVEDTFAMQFEESERLRNAREENMYRRQADNYADLERSNQALIKALGSLEDTMSSLVGARTSSRAWMNVIGRVGQVVGAGMMLAPGAGTVAGAALLAGSTALTSGDPPDVGMGTSTAAPGLQQFSSAANDDKIKIPYGYGKPQKYKTLTEVKQHPDFQKVHPTFQKRLLAMFRANPNVGIGDSHRDTAEQEAEFFRRHEETTQGNHDRVYKGKYYKLVRGAPYAPPGSSMHEIGLASDLIGDLTWMNANAHRFGIKHFAGVNGEPWHVQPAELPNSRREYERSGAPWGTDSNAGSELGTGLAEFVDEAAHADGGEGGSSYNGIAATDFTGASMQAVVDAFLAMGPVAAGAFGSGGHGGGTPSGSGYGDGYAGVGSAANFDGPVSTGAMAAAQAAFRAGFRGDALAQIVAIAGRESGWNSDAVNPNTSDRGMWQINWATFKKEPYADFRRQHGIETITDLLNVDKNAAAAFKMYQDSVAQGRPWHPWKASSSSAYLGGKPGWDPDGDHMWHTENFAGEATAAATAVMNQSGDPAHKGVATFNKATPQPRVAAAAVMAGAAPVVNNYNIQFSPAIKFEGRPETPELRALAQELGGYLHEELELATKRRGA